MQVAINQSTMKKSTGCFSSFLVLLFCATQPLVYGKKAPFLSITDDWELEINDGATYVDKECSASGSANLEERDSDFLARGSKKKFTKTAGVRGKALGMQASRRTQAFPRSSSYFFGRSMNGPPYISGVNRGRPNRRGFTPSPRPTAAPSVSPQPSPSPTKKPTEAPTVSPMPTTAPSVSPTLGPRTRFPFSRQAPRRPMRRFRPGNIRSSNGFRTFSQGKSSRGGTRGRYIALSVESTLVFDFFPGSGRRPTNREIGNLIDQTESFYYDTLQQNPITRNEVSEFVINNVAAEYAPDGNTDLFILYFDGNAVVPFNSILRSDDISRIMADANYNTYIRNYAWQSAPVPSNEFYQTNAVSFAGQAIRYGSGY